MYFMVDVREAFEMCILTMQPIRKYNEVGINVSFSQFHTFLFYWNKIENIEIRHQVFFLLYKRRLVNET